MKRRNGKAKYESSEDPFDALFSEHFSLSVFLDGQTELNCMPWRRTRRGGRKKMPLYYHLGQAFIAKHNLFIGKQLSGHGHVASGTGYRTVGRMVGWSVGPSCRVYAPVDASGQI